MQVKVFEAEDMAGALQKVRKALGPDALILSTRVIRKKGMGILGKPITEITAAIDKQNSPEPVKEQNRPAAAPLRSGLASQPINDITYDDVWRTDRIINPISNEIQELREQLESSKILSIRKEIDEIKGMVQCFAKEVSDLGKALAGNVWSGRPYPVPAGADWLAPVAAELTQRGIQTQAAAEILKLAVDKLTPQQVTSRESLAVFFEEAISSILQANDSIMPHGSAAKRVALVGPTGVGKTTTIAKLAAAYLKGHGRDLALITIDTYRIAAVEQLKVYGEIMNLEVDVVITPEQLTKSLNRHKDKKLILIDTAGRSPKDERNIAELAAFLKPEPQIESHLVLAATAREQELFSAVKRFGVLGLHSFIFTKLDECENYGALLNVHSQNDCPLSYLTDGQRVPEDLLLADPGKIAGLIMGKPYDLRSNNAVNA
jgi:flagellar biosynthesis protein FlhF